MNNRDAASDSAARSSSPAPTGTASQLVRGPGVVRFPSCKTLFQGAVVGFLLATNGRTTALTTAPPRQRTRWQSVPALREPVTLEDLPREPVLPRLAEPSPLAESPRDNSEVWTPQFRLAPGVCAAVYDTLYDAVPYLAATSPTRGSQGWDMPGLAPWRFRAIPCFQLGILHPSLPGLVQPTTKTFAYKTKRPGGLPCELFVSATKDQQGITIRTMGCSLMGPRHGPNVKAGVGADVHWEGNTITVRKQKFRLGVVGAGFSGYVDFRLDGAVRAKIGRKAFVDGHPVLFLMLDRQLRPPRVQQLPQS